MTIDETTHPNIARLVDESLHHEIVDKVKEYLDLEEGLNREEILDKIDVCYDENNIPSTIYMDTIEGIVDDVDNFESFLAD